VIVALSHWPLLPKNDQLTEKVLALNPEVSKKSPDAKWISLTPGSSYGKTCSDHFLWPLSPWGPLVCPTKPLGKFEEGITKGANGISPGGSFKIRWYNLYCWAWKEGQRWLRQNWPIDQLPMGMVIRWDMHWSSPFLTRTRLCSWEGFLQSKWNEIHTWSTNSSLDLGREYRVNSG